MGYYIFSYGINTSEIEKAFGSKDEALLEKVQENDIFQNYSENEFDDDITVEQALVQLINGEPKDENLGYAYGYATIGLCATLGTVLPHEHEIKLGYETDLIKKALRKDFGIENLVIEEVLLADDSHPFPLPSIYDWPVIGLVRLNQLQSLAGQLKTINISESQIEQVSIDDEENGFAYEHIKCLIDNIHFCIQNNLDLISFCH